jgi:hypothetical protein
MVLRLRKNKERSGGVRDIPAARRFASGDLCKATQPGAMYILPQLDSPARRRTHPCTFIRDENTNARAVMCQTVVSGLRVYMEYCYLKNQV